jgi:hypothetical protein
MPSRNVASESVSTEPPYTTKPADPRRTAGWSQEFSSHSGGGSAIWSSDTLTARINLADVLHERLARCEQLAAYVKRHELAVP